MSNTYETRQEASGIKVGDRVRVLRSVPDYTDGWGNDWTKAMDQAVGSVGVVKSLNGLMGVEVEIPNVPERTAFGDNFCYPYFCLEKVEPQKEDCSSCKTSCASSCKDNMWGSSTVCPVCGAPAYQGLGKAECSKGCQL